MTRMPTDAYGLPVSTADPEALALYDRAVPDADARAPDALAARRDGAAAAVLRVLLARQVSRDARAHRLASDALSGLVLRARPARLRAGGRWSVRGGHPRRGGGAAPRAQRPVVGARARARALRVRVVRRRRHPAAGRHPSVPRGELVPQPPAVAPRAAALRARRVRARGEDRPRGLRARAVVDRRRAARLDLAAVAPRARRPVR